MKFYDKRTGFFVADPSVEPTEGIASSYENLLKSADSLILSSSGWRKIFAENDDEESRTEIISKEDTILAGIMALSFCDFIKKKSMAKNPLIVIGMDSRPTGPAISDIMSRIFIAEGMNLQNVFISPAPEIMAYSALEKNIDGFAYISASHNPVGHNGLKFGAKGGVYGGDDSKKLISLFKKHLGSKNIIQRIRDLSERADLKIYTNTLEQIPNAKQKAFDSYLSFSRVIIANTWDRKNQNEFFRELRKSSSITGIGVVGELNGSARTLSIDKDILEEAGVELALFNDKPGDIVHRIVPEGESLNECRMLLEEKYAKDSKYLLGYVPDNDGDRGNIVYIDSGKAKILEAQEVFALSVLGELSFIYREFQAKKDKIAVVVNGPTSMRVDIIASYFGAEVFRAEVGEANAVNLAENLRNKGYTVRILGEGSNGGNITHPAKVRDPLNTVFSLLKILLYKNSATKENIFELWCRLSNQMNSYKDNYTLRDVIETLPSFTTTSAYETRAIMKIQTTDHVLLKKRYEEIFIREWDSKRSWLLENFGVAGWKEINYEGTETKEGFGRSYRSGKEKGGLKILFLDSRGEKTDYIWMRGSGTEPVFRILADCKGKDTERESWFLNWHRSIIEKADKGGVE